MHCHFDKKPDVKVKMSDVKREEILDGEEEIDEQETMSEEGSNDDTADLTPSATAEPSMSTAGVRYASIFYDTLLCDRVMLCVHSMQFQFFHFSNMRISFMRFRESEILGFRDRDVFS